MTGENMRVAKLTVALVVALHAAWSSTANADGVLMIRGSASPREREIITDSFQIAARSLTWTLTAPRLGRDVVDAATKCLSDKTPWNCLAQDVRSSDPLVIVQIDNDRANGASTTIATGHVLVAGNQSDVSATRYCEMCNEETFKRSISELSKQLLQDAAERSGRTKLAVHSQPDKAWITLDGQTIGSTNATRATYPGLHTITLRRLGYKAIARDIVAIDGKTLELEFDLQPDPNAPHISDGNAHQVKPAPQAGPSRLVPGLMIGAGAAAIVAGGAWLWLDEDPKLSGPQERTYRDTTTYGVVSIAAGAAIVGVGVVLLLRVNSTSTAAIAPLPNGGAAATWGWQF
jgi:PEGA domain